ncbi:CBS domain-containing protein, partial [Polaribacter sp.]|uniref:CBS domain-containing protein n=1 Tax=Polaribacter sp. TaxID=1920175 RepID=UPI003F6A36BB
MNINDYILKEIEAFDLNDSVNKAQTLFKNYPITHFPVIKNEKLLGSFAEEDIQTLEDNTGVLENHSYLLQRFYADKKATVLELLRIFAMHNTTIIPVLNANKDYIGYYDLSDVLDLFSSSPFMSNDSETLVVEKLELEYSMGEVSQIVEANGGKLLGMFI